MRPRTTGTGGPGRRRPLSPSLSASSGLPHDDVNIVDRALPPDAERIDRPPSPTGLAFHPPAEHAAADAEAALAAADCAAQLTAERAVRGLFTSDDDSESDVYDDCASPWTENDDVDVVNRTVTTGAAAPPTSPSAEPERGRVAAYADTLMDRVERDRPTPTSASTPVLKRFHSELSLASAVSVALPAGEPPRSKKKRRGRDATPPGPSGR